MFHSPREHFIFKKRETSCSRLINILKKQTLEWWSWANATETVSVLLPAAISFGNIRLHSGEASQLVINGLMFNVPLTKTNVVFWNAPWFCEWWSVRQSSSPSSGLEGTIMLNLCRQKEMKKLLYQLNKNRDLAIVSTTEQTTFTK